MKSAQRGSSTSAVEVTNVSPRGFWLFIDDREVFAAFEHFPWFREASIADLLRVERPSPHHLYWPTLDIDLALESLEHPDRYPLLSRACMALICPSSPSRPARTRTMCMWSSTASVEV